MPYTADENRYATIPYRRCSRSGHNLPALSLGFWHNFGGTSTYENVRAMARTAFDAGITHFDLVNNYSPPRLAPKKPDELAEIDRIVGKL